MPSLQGLLDLHAELTIGDAPMLYRTSMKSRGTESFQDEVGLPIRVERRRESQTLVIELNTERPKDELMSARGDLEDQFTERVVRLSQGEDDRRLHPDDTQGFEIARYQSEIDWLPVVGPGGGVVINRFRDRLRGDVGVRSRSERVSSRWRDAKDIAAELEDRIRDEYDRLEFVHGYFEASQYVRQDWIRTAWLIHIERDSSERNAGRRYSVLVASTNADDLPTTAGLEGTGVGGCNER